VGALLARVNKARHDEALPPYAFTENLLSTAAQRHADDLAAKQSTSHTGSDGSTPERRVAEAGYAAWTMETGEPAVGELIWVGPGTVDDAMAFFLEKAAGRDKILSMVYREMGIGVAHDGRGYNYYVLVFGARPNVLPIFINEGAVSTEVPQVAVWLTNERARPGGQGLSMGQAIEIRIGNDPNWDVLPWQPWEELIFWTLPDTPGEHTVYVQFRDAAGRTAASADSIYLGEAPPTSTPSSPVPASGGSPVPGATALPANQTPVPLPSATPPRITVTPFPTWTPLPTPTVPQEPASPNPPPLGLVAALQGVALILGIFLALHRGRESRDAGAMDDGQGR